MKFKLSAHGLRSAIFSLFIIAAVVGWPGTGLPAQVTLVWDASAEPTVAGYKVYYGTASRNYTSVADAAKNSTATISGLTQGQKYYFAVTAYASSGLESSYSNEVTYAVAVAAGASCTFTLAPTSASYSASGGSGTLSVTTQQGCQWTTANSTSWMSLSPGAGTGPGTVTCTASANPGTASRTAALTIAGNMFTVQQAGAGSQYTISASAGSGGLISPSGSVTVGYGSSRTFTIAASSGYRIADVKVDGVSVGAVASYTFSNVTAAHTIQATFSSVTTYTLSVTRTGAGTGTVTSNPSGTQFVSGTSVTLTATPSAGSTFTGWSGACSGTSTTCALTLNANKSVTATFGATGYTISASAGSGGLISPSGSVTVGYGSSRTFTIAASSGYRIADVKVDGVSVGAVASYTFNQVTAAHTILASFSLRESFTLSVSKQEMEPAV